MVVHLADLAGLRLQDVDYAGTKVCAGARFSLELNRVANFTLVVLRAALESLFSAARISDPSHELHPLDRQGVRDAQRIAGSHRFVTARKQTRREESSRSVQDRGHCAGAVHEEASFDRTRAGHGERQGR